ncbi:MAG TPA: hypothetical protein VFT37_15685 [Telluria sp.]|nr:hypothetical protein [Telluria sp.]
MEFASSVLSLNPGVYILRHPKTGVVPLTVARSPGLQKNNGKLEVIGTPGTEGTILRNGADCIVMHVSGGPIELVVTAYLEKAGTAVPSLRVDQVALDGQTTPAPAHAAPQLAQPGQKPIQIPASGVSVIAHLERKGDLVATNGGLLGEPDSNLRLEGFQVMWPDRPHGADIAYNIAVEGIGPLPVVKSGKFCGTRGQARRITETTFSLVGPQAGEFQLEGTAYFTGGFQVPVESGQPLGGPSGLEHLTALSLNVVKAKAKSRSAVNPWDASPRTKVFKSKAGSASAVKPAAVTPPAKKAASKPALPAKAVAVKAATKKAAPKAAAAKAVKATKAAPKAVAKGPVKSSTKAVKAAKKK